MVDFIRPQILEGCRLAMPEGLKELMSDISREVLRAQPLNLYSFIADYLSALMVVRENMAIAARLCDDVCTGHCNLELEDQLRDIGFDEDDVMKAQKIIVDHLEGGKVNEQSIMIKLAKKTKLDGSHLTSARDAIWWAIVSNRFTMENTTSLYESSSDSDSDEVTRAVKHTLRLYRKCRHTPEEYTRAATKIQAAYRSYGVRRSGPPGQEMAPRQEKTPERNLRFHAEPSTSHDASSPPVKACMPSQPSVSSTSLAGSYLHLPVYIPYSIHERVPENDELDEKESFTVYYNEENSTPSGHKRISFQDIPEVQVEDKADLADDESEISVEEDLPNHLI